MTKGNQSKKPRITSINSLRSGIVTVMMRDNFPYFGIRSGVVGAW